MNPSTEDILNTVDKINADDIFIFPNNSNIILVSRASCKNFKKNLHIIKTKLEFLRLLVHYLILMNLYLLKKILKQ